MDIPVLAEVDEMKQSPTSIGYVGATISLGPSLTANIYICIDSGADLTVCTSQFLIRYFGPESLKQVKTEGFKDPDLKSATGHTLKMMGRIAVCITLGTYTFEANVLVYSHKNAVFLVGNDCIYNRLIYNAGQTIAFVDSSHKPVPLKYFKPFKSATTIRYCSVAPHSSSLVEVQVSKPQGIPCQTILLSPIKGHLEGPGGLYSHVADTVSTVAENGTAYAWVENNTDDQLDIFPDVPIAEVTVISDQINSIVKDSISRRFDKTDHNESWSLKAFKALKDKLPVSLKINWNYLEGSSEATTDASLDMKHISLPEITEGHQVNLIQDKFERAQFIDGSGTEFPSPCAHELSDLPQDPNNTEWIEKVDRDHLTPEQWILLKDLILRKSQAFAKHKGDI